ncbi:2'-5' RNA ligase family protein [Streptomyces niveus]|uniref:2'-5' RNA ligase family protein n=1 Tax=Streptomyces niveus TaxID=193462 RepID=UPI0036F11C38
MRDHWWWRPGWGLGRRFYTWHLIFDGQEDVHRLAADYRGALAEVAGLTPIPDQWLHLTMQGIGFVGEVEETDVDDIVRGAIDRLSKIPSFDLRLGEAIVDPEAVLVPVTPAEPVRSVRDALRAAIGDVLQEVPEKSEGFVPHVSVAYSAAGGRAEPIVQTLAAHTITPATARIGAVELIVIHRDNRMYEWAPHTRVSLG